MTNKKRQLGQFFTKKGVWLKPQVVEFMKRSNCQVAYDPFAGSGDLLSAAKELGFKKTIGLDIDKSLSFRINDSLLAIPKVKNALIITNPPYLTNYSAKRKKIFDNVSKYFASTNYSDLYLLALEKMLEAQEFVLAIIPETFINSNFKHFGRLSSVTILEENCFDDTENPVCVACFDGKYKMPDKIKVYKNGNFADTLENLEKKRLKPHKRLRIRFNVVEGNVALRAVDSVDDKKRIAFMPTKDLDYDLRGIKESSRLITIVDVSIKNKDIENKFIDHCNKILENYRSMTDDILFSPFKGNTKRGVRRRRLDYETARSIMEKAYEKVEKGCNGQLRFI